MIEIISKGAHWRNVHLPETSEPRQFAHIFDPDEAEDVPHQAQNFVQYGNALGSHVGPHVLIGPGPTDDPIEDQHVLVELCDWRMIVESATHVPVEIR